MRKIFYDSGESELFKFENSIDGTYFALWW